MRFCEVQTCGRPRYCWGYCSMHYQRAKKYGDPLAGQPRSRGDAVGYRAAHTRVVVARGKASEHACVDCGRQASDWSYRQTSGWSPNPADYDPRCRSCHLIKDGNSRAKETV